MKANGVPRWAGLWHGCPEKRLLRHRARCAAHHRHRCRLGEIRVCPSTTRYARQRRMLTMMPTGVMTAIFLIAVASCTSSGGGAAASDAGERGSADAPVQNVQSDAAASGAAACAEAGGTCIPEPPSNCGSGNLGPPNCDPGPSGSVCCLPEPADASGGDAAPVACANSQDCFSGPIVFSGPVLWCCIEKTCVYGQSAVDAVPCTDAGAQAIQASNYDQSCNIDSDCVEVAEKFCYLGAVCPNAAINKNAYAQYQVDVAKTLCGTGHSCGATGVPCCRSGSCQFGDPCFAPADAAMPSADARVE